MSEIPILGERPTRRCGYCGETLKGRSDKKFCSSECRNGYHNHLASQSDAFMRRVNKILRKNRKALAELNPNGKVSVKLERLLDRGFNPNYFTHLYTTKEGKEYRFCYEYGYMYITETLVLLVRREYDESGEPLRRRSSSG